MSVLDPPAESTGTPLLLLLFSLLWRAVAGKAIATWQPSIFVSYDVNQRLV